ncbi:HNH endonuclease signature motif containing protein [Kribbella sp.]|uniref:HNH endonuclease signature motif containing protein n=1 Tax=Kribbella sp. TaxID=1871183 RepID=UPI002D75C9FD|nr:DUF222 domain-containing protein [Kribbella sp.]HZX03457.1 DUF222 domain-containing protein [Kribbella sp.]
MDVLDGRSVVSLSDGELLPALDAIDVQITRLEELRLQLIARIEDTGYAQELGARDAVELVSRRYRRDRAEAWRDVRLAKALPKYKAIATALDAPQGARPMRTAQAAAIVSELERVRSRVPVEDLDVVEEQFVGLAAHMSPAELRSAARQVCDLLDSDGPEPEEHKAAARETLTLTAADRGVKFRGYLANENAELLRAVIHAGARPHKTVDGEHDPRPRDKRQADALTTALTVAANAWDTDTPGHGAKANITVTIDLDDLKSATATATGQTVYSDDLSAATIRRLACDANIIPLVLGSNSEPLDVGRRERLVTKHIRHALNARDKGCVVCSAPPVMCDAHHLTAWQDGGVTALTNLALLCRRHHTDLHTGRWTITITNGKPHVARPTWATPTAPTPTNPTPTNHDPTNTALTTEAHRARPQPTSSSRSDPPPADRPRATPHTPAPTAAAPACLEHPDNNPSSDPPTDNSRPPKPFEPPANPWGDTNLPTPRTTRWTANEATLTAATHFAVWGNHTPTEPATDPPPFAMI